jgi:hypothetical protein
MVTTNRDDAAAVVKGTKDPGGSTRLIEFLASENATPMVEQLGMERPGLGALKPMLTGT